MTGPITLSKRLSISLVMFVIAWPIFGTVISIQNSVRVERAQRESEQKLCTVIVLIDDTSRNSPAPESERAKKFAEAYSALRASYHCAPPERKR